MERRVPVNALGFDVAVSGLPAVLALDLRNDDGRPVTVQAHWVLQNLIDVMFTTDSSNSVTTKDRFSPSRVDKTRDSSDSVATKARFCPLRVDKTRAQQPPSSPLHDKRHAKSPDQQQNTGGFCSSSHVVGDSIRILGHTPGPNSHLHFTQTQTQTQTQTETQTRTRTQTRTQSTTQTQTQTLILALTLTLTLPKPEPNPNPNSYPNPISKVNPNRNLP